MGPGEHQPITRPDAPRPALRPSVQRLVIAALLAAIAFITIAAMQSVWMAGRIPEWWDRAAAPGPDAPRRAEAVERGVTTAAHSVRPDDAPWRVELREEDANAWLAERLPRWLTNRGVDWPETLSLPRVRFGRDRVTLGVAMLERDGRIRRVASIDFAIDITESGQLFAGSARAQLGVMALPSIPGPDAFDSLLSTMAPRSMPPRDREALREGAVRVVRALRGEHALVEAASLALEDGRRVRLLAAEPAEGRLRLTCVTEPNARAGR